MKITKAILLTILLQIIYYIPQLGLFGIVRYTNTMGEEFHEYVIIIVILSSLISYLIVFYFYWKPRPKLKSELNIKQLNFSLIPYLMLIVIGLGFAEQPLFDFEKIMNYYQNSEVEPHTYKFLGFTTFFLYFRASSLLIAPIFEEMFFRKLLFSKLLEKNKLWTAILISSLCFSAIHFETPNNLIPTFIFGVIACVIYLKTKNIIYPIIIHFLNNLCSALYSIYGEPFFDWIYGLNYNFMYWALFAFGILITTLGIKRISTADNV